MLCYWCRLWEVRGGRLVERGEGGGGGSLLLSEA